MRSACCHFHTLESGDRGGCARAKLERYKYVRSLAESDQHSPPSPESSALSPFPSPLLAPAPPSLQHNIHGRINAPAWASGLTAEDTVSQLL